MHQSYVRIPDLSRCSSREMVIKSTYDAFEGDLIQWVSECVTHDISDAEDLVCGIPNLDKFYAVARQPQLNMSNKRRIHAYFNWGVLPNHRWVPTSVRFWIPASQLEIASATHRLEREKQLALAERRQMKKGPDIRKMVFPAEDHDAKHLALYIQQGNWSLAECFQAVYNSAKEDAELPENPFENPLKDAKSVRDLVIKTALTHIPGKAGKEISEAAEKGYKAKEITDGVIKKNAFKLAVTGTEIVAKKYVEGAGAPFIGFFEMAVGGWFDACISGQAGRVAKIRSHGYVYFTYGFLSAMVMAKVPQPRNAAEHKYFRGGENAVRKLCGGDYLRFQVQVALLDYARRNATGEWEFKLHPDKWIYPDDYIRKWSPQALGRSMLTQLCKKKYTVD